MVRFLYKNQPLIMSLNELDAFIEKLRIDDKEPADLYLWFDKREELEKQLNSLLAGNVQTIAEQIIDHLGLRASVTDDPHRVEKYQTLQQLITSLESMQTIRETVKNKPEKVYALDDNSALKIIDGKIEVVSEGKWLEIN